MKCISSFVTTYIIIKMDKLMSRRGKRKRSLKLPMANPKIATLGSFARRFSHLQVNFSLCLIFLGFLFLKRTWEAVCPKETLCTYQSSLKCHGWSPFLELIRIGFCFLIVSANMPKVPKEDQTNLPPFHLKSLASRGHSQIGIPIFNSNMETCSFRKTQSDFVSCKNYAKTKS